MSRVDSTRTPPDPLRTPSGLLPAALVVGGLTAVGAYFAAPVLPGEWAALARPAAAVGHGCAAALALVAFVGLRHRGRLDSRLAEFPADVSQAGTDWDQVFRFYKDHEDRFRAEELHEQFARQREQWRDALSRRTCLTLAVALLPALLGFVESWHGLRVETKNVLPAFGTFALPLTVGAVETLLVGGLVLLLHGLWERTLSAWLSRARAVLDADRDRTPPVATVPEPKTEPPNGKPTTTTPVDQTDGPSPTGPVREPETKPNPFPIPDNGPYTHYDEEANR